MTSKKLVREAKNDNPFKRVIITPFRQDRAKKCNPDREMSLVYIVHIVGDVATVRRITVMAMGNGTVYLQ